MSFSKETGSQPKLTVLAATKLGNKCLRLKSGKVFLKKHRGTYVMRFAPRTAQAGTVRKPVRKWNLGLPLYTYPLLCISAGAEPMERALIHGAVPTTLILWKTHIQGYELGAVAESPGNFPVSLA